MAAALLKRDARENLEISIRYVAWTELWLGNVRHVTDGIGPSTYAEQQHLDAVLPRGHQQRQVHQGCFEIRTAKLLMPAQLLCLFWGRPRHLLNEEVKAPIDKCPRCEAIIFAGEEYVSTAFLEYSPVTPYPRQGKRPWGVG